MNSFKCKVISWQVIVKGQTHTCAVQVLYWVNIASYSAMRPLCPAAAQALASRTGTAWSNRDLNELNSTSKNQQLEYIFRISLMLKTILLWFTMSFSWFCPECKACLTLWDNRISCLSRCFPNATAPLVTIIISLPWFCSMATWQRRRGQWCSYLLSRFWWNHGQRLIAVYIRKAVTPAPQSTQGVPVRVHTHPASPQRCRALQQFVWPALTHCDGQRISHGDEGGWLQHKIKCKMVGHISINKRK